MERSLDYKGRWRNHTVAFRVSDEEAKLLNDLVALSGLTKQECVRGKSGRKAALLNYMLYKSYRVRIYNSQEVVKNNHDIGDTC